ncbi:Tautomerase/MIF [Trametes gibbosa]|nr:Tautomerase/MIF [Trametes gibbosa]
MPTLELKTNVVAADPKTLCIDLAKLAAEVLGKPEAFVSANYIYSEYLTFGGSFEPAFYLVVGREGKTSNADNEMRSKAFFAFLKERIGVDDTRGYIVFTDPGRTNIGFRSTTVDAILSARNM